MMQKKAHHAIVVCARDIKIAMRADDII